MNSIQENTRWYWEQLPQQNNIIVPTCTIVYPCLDVMIKIKKRVCNKNQELKTIQRRNICLTDSDHNFIPDKIKHIYTI